MGEIESTMDVEILGIISPLWCIVKNSKTLEPINEAKVVIASSSRQQEGYTDADGKKYFGIMETDFYDFSVSKKGYRSQTRTVKLFAPDESIMEVDIRAIHESIMEVEITT